MWAYVESGDEVCMAATCDGADLAWNLLQVSAGIKIVDPWAINPLTNQLLFGDSGYDRVQSAYACYPLHVHINNLEEQYRGGLKVAQGADMFSIQKIVCHGGAMKSKSFACYFCNIHKNDLIMANAVPCDDCIAGNSLHPCYHQLISDEELIQRFRTEKRKLEQHWPHLLLLPPTRSRIRFGTLDISDPRYDPLHIEYVPTSVNARIQHARLIEEELIMRGLHVIGANTAVRKLQLHEVLVTEQR